MKGTEFAGDGLYRCFMQRLLEAVSQGPAITEKVFEKREAIYSSPNRCSKTDGQQGK
jgi:hypothetical protein